MTKDDGKSGFSDHAVKHNPPAGLGERIMLRIRDRRELRAAEKRLLWFGGLSLAALVAIIPAWQEMVFEGEHSGFITFLSLILSDGKVISVFWQDFLFLLLESLPIVGIAAVLLSISTLVFSARFVVRDLGIVFRRSHLRKA